MASGGHNKGVWRTPAGTGGFNELYSKYKRQAKNRTLKFELSKDDFRHLTSSNCYYCGIEPLQKCYGKGRDTPEAVARSEYIYNGVDRLYNEDGYNVLNCVPCCGLCNYRKHDNDRDEFIEWVNRVYHPCHEKLNVGI